MFEPFPAFSYSRYTAVFLLSPNKTLILRSYFLGCALNVPLLALEKISTLKAQNDINRGDLKGAPTVYKYVQLLIRKF